MENATDALIMAASVLLLIIALTVNITSFSSMKTDLDNLLNYDERVDKTVQTDSGLVNYLKASADDIRTVEANTVITSIRRTRVENCNVYIIAKKGTALNNYIVDNIDNEQTLGNAIEKDFDFSKTGAITEGNKGSYNNNVIKVTLYGAGYKNILNTNVLHSFYNAIKGTQFKEYIGEYKPAGEEVSSVNKLTYRVLTYVEV